MDIDGNTKDILAIQKFLFKFKEDFKLDKVILESRSPNDSSVFNPETNQYPLSIIAHRDFEKWNFHWTSSDQIAIGDRKPYHFLVFYNSELSDKRGNIYGYDAVRSTIKYSFPEAFQKSFYDYTYKFDTDSEIMNQDITTLLEAIELSKELPINKEIKIKKIKL